MLNGYWERRTYSVLKMLLSCDKRVSPGKQVIVNGCIQRPKIDTMILLLRKQLFLFNLKAPILFIVHWLIQLKISLEVFSDGVNMWLRIHVLMQGTWVGSLPWEDPTCHWATKPVPQLLMPMCLESMLSNMRSLVRGPHSKEQPSLDASGRSPPAAHP